MTCRAFEKECGDSGNTISLAPHLVSAERIPALDSFHTCIALLSSGWLLSLSRAYKALRCGCDPYILNLHHIPTTHSTFLFLSGCTGQPLPVPSPVPVKGSASYVPPGPSEGQKHCPVLGRLCMPWTVGRGTAPMTLSTTLGARRVSYFCIIMGDRQELSAKVPSWRVVTAVVMWPQAGSMVVWEPWPGFCTALPLRRSHQCPPWRMAPGPAAIPLWVPREMWVISFPSSFHS